MSSCFTLMTCHLQLRFGDSFIVKADNAWASALCFAFVEVCLAWKDSVKGAYHRKPERQRDSRDHRAEFDNNHGEVEARTVQMSMTTLDTSAWGRQPKK